MAATLTDIELYTTGRSSRLPPMLFLAALAHGILIIGVTFNMALMPESADAISLEVTIVAEPKQRIIRSDDAAYLAQSSQRGGGNTRNDVRPSAPAESLSPIDNLGDSAGDRLLEAKPNERVADQQLATTFEAARRINESLRDPVADDSATAAKLESGIQNTLPLPQDRDATLRIRDDDPRQLVVAADTQASIIAGYLDRWKRKIEAIGAAYIPELGNLGAGSPTLQVTIDAQGHLVDIVVLRSSGSPSLDQAALRILRRAAPFDPFPQQIREEYDSLRFAYKWQFETGGVRR
jgi:protein TonB